MKKKVRVTAAITKNQFGGYRVVLSNGVYSDYPTLQDAQRYANYKNNEDADDPEYMYVEEEVVSVQTYQPTSEDLYERRMKESKEREEKKRIEKESNRKATKTDDKYVFVVSCNLRGESGVVYLQGETDLTKITYKYGGGFITNKEENAKVFQTKASAQKFIDKIEKCWMVNALLRSMKVVRKPRK